MASKLEFTGERFTPECVREIWYEHMHRYALAAQLCRGRDVLDAACGEGYGSALLASQASQVTGVDLSSEAINHATERYAGVENLRFTEGDCTRLSLPDDSVDCVVSFETLEHLEDQDGMLREFQRVMKPEGFLLLSSPDKAVYTEQLGNQNEFHVRELYRDELLDLLSRHFSHHHLLGQRLLFHSAIWSLRGSANAALQQLHDGEVQTGEKVPQAPVYFIVLCANREDYLPELSHDLWLFDDREESVYGHYVGEIRRNMDAGAIIADRDRQIKDLKNRLDEVTKVKVNWLQRWRNRG